MYIIYVEDEPNDAHLIERFFKHTPHKLEIIPDISEALAATEKEPDVVLVDMIINHTREGYDFVRKLRSNGYKRPIIAVTGLAQPGDLEQCMLAGCTEVLNKPYMIHELSAVLDKYIA
jgi:CheY-like chemotaxis protein